MRFAVPRYWPLAGSVLLLVFLLATATSTRAAQEATPVATDPGHGATADGSFVVYAFACPRGFSGQDYAACRATPRAGLGLTAFPAGSDNGVGAVSDGDGVAAFPLSVLAPGDVVVVGQAPDGADFAAACSQDFAYVDGGIVVPDVAADAFVTCEWYELPPTPAGGDGSLEIWAFGCPAGFDGDDYAACREKPLAAVGFSVAAVGQGNGVGATTGGDGLATFPLFAADLPGNIGVVAALPEGYGGFEAVCQAEPGIATDYADTGAGITLLGVEPGAQIACDWFALPSSDDPAPAPTATRTATRTQGAPEPRDRDEDRRPTAVAHRLPNTGVGGADGGNQSGHPAGAAPLVALVACFGLARLLAPARRQLVLLDEPVQALPPEGRALPFGGAPAALGDADVPRRRRR